MKKLLFCLLAYFCGPPFFAPGQSIRTDLLPGSVTIGRSVPPPSVNIRPSPLPTSISIRITNDSLQKNYTNITLQWQLLVNGLVRQKGILSGLTLLPGHPRMFSLPLKTPGPGEEAYIKVEYRETPRGPLTYRTRIAPPSTPILAAQTLAWKAWGGDIRIPVTGELGFADSSDVFTVSSPTLRLSFDKESGWIREYQVDQFHLLTDTNGLRPAIPVPAHLQLFSTSTGSRMVIVRTEYTLPELSCLLHLSYTVNADGALLVEQTLETDTSRKDSILHPIDRFGMTWMLPFTPDSITWYGLAAGIPANSSSADRMADTLPSIQSAQASAAKNVRWWSIRDRYGKGFRLTADSNFLYQVSITAANTVIAIDDHPIPHPTPPVHYHYAYKLTPLTSLQAHPAPAKPF